MKCTSENTIGSIQLRTQRNSNIQISNIAQAIRGGIKIGHK